MILFDKLIQTTKVNLVKENFCMEEYDKGREGKNLKKAQTEQGKHSFFMLTTLLTASVHWQRPPCNRWGKPC